MPKTWQYDHVCKEQQQQDSWIDPPEHLRGSAYSLTAQAGRPAIGWQNIVFRLSIPGLPAWASKESYRMQNPSSFCIHHSAFIS